MVIFKHHAASALAVPLVLTSVLVGCASEGEQTAESAPAVKATMVYYAMPG